MSQLEFVTTEPPNAATPLGLLDGAELGPGEVYLRNNFPPPTGAPSLVGIELPDAEFTLSPEQLEALPPAEVSMVLECAGNGRTFMDPVPEGTPWGLGAASPVRFGGARLLDAIGSVPDEITELIFTGADSGIVEPEGEVNYQFSLTRPEWDTAVLATRLAGAALPFEHGGSVRLVVPGQYAMKSVKWLQSIRGSEGGFTGHFVQKYRYFGMTGMPDGLHVGPVRVRCVISEPATRTTVAPGPITVRGSSWSGHGQVASVEVSTNGGQHWIEADLDKARPAHAAQAWKVEISLSAGRHEILARATDSAGNAQPLEPVWNRNGYGNNVVHRIVVDAL